MLTTLFVTGNHSIVKILSLIVIVVSIIASIVLFIIDDRMNYDLRSEKYSTMTAAITTAVFYCLLIGTEWYEMKKSNRYDRDDDVLLP